MATGKRVKFLMLLGWLAAAGLLLAQDAASPPDDADTTELPEVTDAGTALEPPGTAAEAVADEVAEETAETANEPVTIPDEESYLDIEEEDFRPSQEIPSDQSIAFPTDI